MPGGPAAALVAVVATVAVAILGGCGPEKDAAGGAPAGRGSGSPSGSASAGARAAVPKLAAGAVPAACAAFDDPRTVAGLDAGTLDDDPTFVDPASHPMPTGEDELTRQLEADSVPGVTCTWSREDAFALLLLTVHPDSSPWYHDWTLANCGAALSDAGTVTLGNGQAALLCTGQYLEELTFTAHGRVYEVARGQEPHSYRDQLVAYADFLAGG
jgi:hypothetical protein